MSTEHIQRRSNEGKVGVAGLALGTPAYAPRPRSRSALGVGVITLVTTLVVLLLATFCVLSLVQARNDLELATKASASTAAYYKADSAATQWYAHTCHTAHAGTYKHTFALDANRELDVKVEIDNQGKPHIERWQAVALANEL